MNARYFTLLLSTPFLAFSAPLSVDILSRDWNQDETIQSLNTRDAVLVSFPDGTLPCSKFPTGYGAVPTNWMNLGGWAGLQAVQSNGAVSSPSTCGEGTFCSYACPPGYLSAQWPASQPSTGQSVGGIQCKSGKLYKTDSNTGLCLASASQVTVQVVNRLSQNVAVCMTNYPGTEVMDIPTNATTGSTNLLSDPDSASYYHSSSGSSSSAQFYVNPAGVSVQNGCQWGSSANPWGNWAPLNIGAGYTQGSTFISLFPNINAFTQLSFSITIQGSTLSGSCKYSNGQYCGSNGCNTNGCTTSASSGTIQVVFS